MPSYMREVTCKGTCLQGTLLKVRGITCSHLRSSLGSPEPKSDCSELSKDVWKLL